MKKISIFLAGTILLAGSCAREMNTVEDGTPTEIRVSINAPAGTKAQTAEEMSVNSVQLFVFRPNGSLDACKYYTSVSSMYLTCTTGTRDVYAVVNRPEITSITSLSDLQAIISDLSDNQRNLFVMSGSKQIEVPAVSSVTIDVQRLVARVFVTKITNEIESSGLTGMNFEVEKIWISNATSTVNLLSGAAGSTYYNTESVSFNCPEMLSYIPTVVNTANGTALDVNHAFYPLPFTTTPELSCRVVIQVRIGGQRYFYPISLHDIERNKSYVISNITIRRLGSDNPQVPVSFKNISYSINVVDWIDTPAYNEAV